MKLSIGYCYEDNAEVESEEVIVDEMNINDSIILSEIVKWYECFRLKKPEKYDLDDIVLVIRP